MAFTLVRGGNAIDQPRDVEETGFQDIADIDPEDEESTQKYDEAMLMNQRLKAMLLEAQQANPRNGTHPNQPRRIPRMPGPPSAGTPTGRGASSSVRAGSCGPEAFASRENSQGINRRKFEEKVHSENAGMAARLADAKSCILPHAGQRAVGVQESSQAINRRRFHQKTQRENASLLNRIETAGRSKSWGPTRKVGDPEMPKGWTRGIGGRMMPPPKLRWGAAPKYDAGDWAS
jgi:hypothetical protein